MPTWWPRSAQFLAQRAARLQALGVAAQRIVLDPGIGFGKTLAHNIELHRGIPALLKLGFPVLVGWSRKSALGTITGQPVQQRLAASVAAALAAAQRGARVLRVHDVAATVDALRVWQALESRNGSFMSRRYFGTDGIRGTVGMTPITPDFMLRLGHAVGSVLRRTVARPTVIIGKDTRISGYMIESALEAGFASAGVDVLLSGPLPTPGVAYLTRALRLDLGVVISASHNPFADNGIKFFSARGEKLPDDWEARRRGRAGRAAALGGCRRPGQGAAPRRCARPLHRVLQEHRRQRAVAQGPEAGGRRRPWRGLPRGAGRVPRAGRRGRGHRLQPRRHQHQPGRRRHRAGGAGAARARRSAPTTASRSTATPTGC